MFVIRQLSSPIQKILTPSSGEYNQGGFGTAGLILYPSADGPAATQVARRVKSSWFQWLQTCLNFLFLVQQVPFTVHFERDRYVVRTSRYKMVLWAALHLTGLLAFCTEIVEEVGVIRSSHDDLKYFDLLHSVGWIAYDYPFIYLMLVKTHLVQEFFDELQDSPLLQVSSPRKPILGALHALLLFWYFITTFMFYPTRWNILDWTLENYYKALKSACELYFRIPVTSEPTPFYVFMIALTFLITTFQYNTVQMDDLLAFTGMLTMKNIASDLDKAIREGHLADEQVIELIAAQKRLTRKFNKTFGFLIAMYVIYATPYYALHLVDMFEIPGLMNQLSMFTFIGLLGLTCKWAIDILMMAKRRKRWMSKRGYVMKVSRSELNVFLDDLVWEKWGIGHYYTVNAYVAGQVLTLILTIAIVRIQSVHSE